MKQRRSPKAITTAKLTAESRIARADVVQLIAAETRRPNESIRQARNKVSHRITYAVDKGHLIKDPDGFKVGDLVLWMRSEWPRLFDDLPASPRQATFASTIKISDSYSARVIPGDLDRCKAALNDAYDQIDRLTLELRAVQVELENLRPLAEKWEDFCAINKAKAKGPRSPK